MAAIGFGLTLKYGNSDPADTLVGAIKSEPRLDQNVGEVDVTNNDSASGWREWLPTLADAVFSFECSYVKTRQTALSGLLRATKHWLVTLPDGSTLKWQGFITAFGSAFPMEGEMMNTVTMRVTGTITFTPAV